MNFNKLCELEDFSDPELVSVIQDVCAHKVAALSSAFPTGHEARKDWEVAMSVRALRHFGALHRDATLLGVAAGTEDTIFYLTRHARQVFVTDRYLGAGAWSHLAPVAMLVEPAFLAPFEFEPQRLVVQHMDGRLLRYPDDTFDGIFSSGSIEHFGELDDVAHAAFEMGRVLKPGGILALSTEFRFSGPPGGIGWPGQTLLLSAADLQRYIVEASGLEPVDELRVDVSDETMATKRDLNEALADHRRRTAADGAATAPEYAHWAFPHIMLVHGGYVFGSVHLTLRKSDAYPFPPNAWAKPATSTLESIAAANEELLTAGTAAAETPVAPPAEPVRPTEPLPNGAWSDRQTAAAELLAAATADGQSAATELMSAIAHRDEVDLQTSQIAHAQMEVDQMLTTVSLRRSDVRRLPRRQPLYDKRLAAHPDPDTSAWKACEVSLDEERRVTTLFDSGAADPVTLALANGQGFLSQELVDLMLEMVGPDDLVLDLGAHIGTFALAAAAAGCSVLAVEASSDNAALLRASASANGFRHLRVVAAAVGDRPGWVDFCARGPWGHVATPVVDLPRQTVLAVTIDELLTELRLPDPAFVKMDIEGSEVAALRGMRRLLEPDDAPPVLYESNGHTLAFFGSSPQQLVAEFADFGYTSYLVESDRLVRIDPREMQPQTEVNCLALKGRPETLRRWQFALPLTFEERIARMVTDCRSPNPDHRAYIAAALRTADAAVLAHPALRDALDPLGQDTSTAVREAVAWWSQSRASEGSRS